MGLLSVTVLQGDAPYMRKATTTTTKVDYFPLPRPLWRKLNKCLPKKKRKKTRGGGRDRGHPTEPSSTPSAMCFGAAASGRLSTAIGSGSPPASSTSVFQSWRRMGVFEKLMRRMVEY